MNVAYVVVLGFLQEPATVKVLLQMLEVYVVEIIQLVLIVVAL